MSNWKTLNNLDHFVPRDRKVIALYRGRICFCEWSDEDNHYWICMDPCESVMMVAKEREGKFTHYMDLPEMPSDW